MLQLNILKSNITAFSNIQKHKFQLLQTCIPLFLVIILHRIWYPYFQETSSWYVYGNAVFVLAEIFGVFHFIAGTVLVFSSKTKVTIFQLSRSFLAGARVSRAWIKISIVAVLGNIVLLAPIISLTSYDIAFLVDDYPRLSVILSNTLFTLVAVNFRFMIFSEVLNDKRANTFQKSWKFEKSRHFMLTALYSIIPISIFSLQAVWFSETLAMLVFVTSIWQLTLIILISLTASSYFETNELERAGSSRAR